MYCEICENRFKKYKKQLIENKLLQKIQEDF